MDLGLLNKVVFITGASSGIGQAIAEVYGREKAKVVITYHGNSRGADQTVQKVISAGGEGLAI